MSISNIFFYMDSYYMKHHVVFRFWDEDLFQEGSEEARNTQFTSIFFDKPQDFKSSDLP